MRTAQLNEAEFNLIQRFRKLEHPAKLNLMATLAAQEAIQASAKALTDLINSPLSSVENSKKQPKKELHESCTTKVFNNKKKKKKSRSKVEPVPWHWE